MTETFANDVPTGALQVNLDGAIDDTQTTITVDGLDGLPTPAEYRIRVDDELMLVTDDTSAPDLDVTRGIEGTDPDNHSDGAVVVHVLTAGVLETFRDGLLPEWWIVDPAPTPDTVTFDGRVGIGGDLADSAYESARLVVFDDGLAGVTEPVTEIHAPQARNTFMWFTTDDRFDGEFPWLQGISTYFPGVVPPQGRDALNFWYGLHTPEDEMAMGALEFHREGTSEGVSIGVRSDSLSEATTGNEFLFLGADLGAGLYPFRFYPFTSSIRLDLEELDTALMDAGDFTFWLDDTVGATKVKFKAKDSAGTVKTGELALT